MAMTDQFPDELDFERQNLDNRRKLAQLLFTQAQSEAPKGQMAGRVYVAPSPLQYLAQGLREYTGAKQMEDADAALKDLGQKRQEKIDADVTAFNAAYKGSPARTVGANEMDSEGYSVPEQAPDRTKALAIALRSRSPALQQAGAGMLKSDLDREEMTSTLKSLGLTPGAAPTAGGVPGATPGAPATVGSGATPQPSGIGGVDPTAAALILRGGTLGKLGETIQNTQKPIALREGDLVLPDGRGGFRSVYSQPKLEAGVQPERDATGRVVGASQIPGYGAAVGDITKAKEGAKAGFEMVTVDTPSGPVMMTKEQAARLSGGAQPSAVPAQPQPRTPMQPAPRVAQPQPDADRVAIYRQEIGAAQQRLANAATPEDRARAQADIDGLTRETQRLGIPLQDDQSKKFGQRVAEKSADDLLEGRDKARNAVNEIANVAEARKAIASGVFAGSGAEGKLSIAKFIQANVPGVQLDQQKLANTDYLKSVLGQGLLAQAKALGANPSNADAQRINEIVGGIDKDPGAMQKILDFRQEMAERAITQHNRTVDDAESRGMRSPYDLRVKVPPKAAAQNKGAAVPNDVDAILKKYGGK